MTEARTGLPRRDVLMAAILTGLMLAADLAVYALRPQIEGRFWPCFTVMPGTLLLIWACYAGSLRLMPRGGKSGSAVWAARIMGWTLSSVGITLAVAHGAMLAYAGGWLPEMDFSIVFRLFAVGLGLNLAMLGNAFAKGARWMAFGGRRIGWVTVVCSLAAAASAIVLPFHILTPVFMTLSFIPAIFILGSTVVFLAGKRP